MKKVLTFSLVLGLAGIFACNSSENKDVQTSEPQQTVDSLIEAASQNMPTDSSAQEEAAEKAEGEKGESH